MPALEAAVGVDASSASTRRSSAASRPSEMAALAGGDAAGHERRRPGRAAGRHAGRGAGRGVRRDLGPRRLGAGARRPRRRGRPPRPRRRLTDGHGARNLAIVDESSAARGRRRGLVDERSKSPAGATDPRDARRAPRRAHRPHLNAANALLCRWLLMPFALHHSAAERRRWGLSGSVATKVSERSIHRSSCRVVRRSADATRSQPVIGRSRMTAVSALVCATSRSAAPRVAQQALIVTVQPVAASYLASKGTPVPGLAAPISPTKVPWFERDDLGLREPGDRNQLGRRIAAAGGAAAVP